MSDATAETRTPETEDQEASATDETETAEVTEASAAEAVAEAAETAETPTAEGEAATGDAETGESSPVEAAGAVAEAAVEDVAEQVEEAAEAAVEQAEEVVEAAAEEVEEAAEAVAEEVEEEVEEAAAEQVEEVVEAAAEQADAAVEAVAEQAEEAAEAVAEQADAAVEAVAEQAEAAIEQAEGAVEQAEGAVETAAEQAEGAVAEAAAAVAEQAEGAAEGAESETTPDELAPEIELLKKALADKEAVEGKIIGWNKGGYHVAIGKVAAFCPVSQIEIGNPRSPKRYMDKTYSFNVMEIQRGGRRVVVSRATALKAERDARAARVREVLKPGAELEGRVSSITDFGAFVDLGGGIEGLVHVSEISRSRVEHPKEVLSLGQTVKVVVVKIERGGKRISLSMKRLEADPWEGIEEKFSPGQEFEGKVVRKTDFGLFVEVAPGLEGLVHTSRLALGSSLEDEALAVDAEIKGWVHEVDRRRRRLSLALRPVAGGNPWKGVEDRYPEGEIIEATVERLADFGAFIELEPGLTGLLPFSMLTGAGNPKRQFQVGKKVSVRVLSIDRERKRISLGTEASKAEGNQKDYREYLKSQKQDSGSGMNPMAAALAKLKEQMSS
ncbi:MAG: S1 RNA-binding domain-containing protein [Acidobacteriota bacterium]